MSETGRKAATVILHCTFEELTAVAAGAELVLERAGSGGGVRVAAPPEVIVEVEALLPRLSGDLSITTLEDQRHVERALAYIVEYLDERMHHVIVDEHPGSEEAINTYFDYAHAYAVRDRVRLIGAEMEALIELMTGEPPTPRSAREMSFPD